MFDRVTDTHEKELAPPAFTVVYDKLKLNAYVHSAAARGAAEVRPPAALGRLRRARGARRQRQPEALRSERRDPGPEQSEGHNLALDIVRDERNEPQQVLLSPPSFSVAERDLPPKVSAWLLPLTSRSKGAGASSSSAGNAPFAWTEANFRPKC